MMMMMTPQDIEVSLILQNFGRILGPKLITNFQIDFGRSQKMLGEKNDT